MHFMDEWRWVMFVMISFFNCFVGHKHAFFPQVEILNWNRYVLDLAVLGFLLVCFFFFFLHNSKCLGFSFSSSGFECSVSFIRL